MEPTKQYEHGDCVRMRGGCYGVIHAYDLRLRAYHLDTGTIVTPDQILGPVTNQNLKALIYSARDPTNQ